MWVLMSSGPPVPRVEDVNAWPLKVVGWYDGPEVEELPESAEHGDWVRCQGRLYVWDATTGADR